MTKTTIDYPTTDDLETSGLRMYRMGLIRNGVGADVATKAIAKGTPIQIRTRQIAELVTGVYANERALEDAQMPDTAVGDDLLRLCTQNGIPKSAGSGAAGNVTVTNTGTATYSAGQELTSAKNGKRYKVVSTTVATTGTGVGVVGVDVGVGTNLPAGEILTWTSPPAGSATTAAVSLTGLIGGQEPDNDARLRKRLLKRLQSPPGGGNWSQLRQWAEQASASVSDAYVYPAVHGPGTAHVVALIEGTPDNGYTRIAPDALVSVVRAAVLAQYNDAADVIVTACQVYAPGIVLRIGLPVSVGGAPGWLDATKWPIGNSTSNRCTISSIVTPTQFVCNATALPAVGSHFVIFDVSNAVFQHFTVISSSGSAGAITVNTNAPLGAITVGAYLGPDATNLDAYLAYVLSQVALLGPGERTYLSSYTRPARRPFISEANPSGFSPSIAARLAVQFGELTTSYVGLVDTTSSPTAPVMPLLAPGLNQLPYVIAVGQIGFQP